MRPLLVILNPRAIPECIEAFHALEIEKAWLTGYTESDLVPVMADVVEQDFSHYIVISDDAIVTQDALDAVLAHCRTVIGTVVTGYSRLDATHEMVNLCKSPLRGNDPHPDAYNLYSYDEVQAYEFITSYFAGMCLTAMSKEMWQRFPFDCFGRGRHAGNASDFHLSLRLQRAGIPIVAPRAAEVEHVKAAWNFPDKTPGRELLIGKVEPAVTFT